MWNAHEVDTSYVRLSQHTTEHGVLALTVIEQSSTDLSGDTEPRRAPDVMERLIPGDDHDKNISDDQG